MLVLAAEGCDQSPHHAQPAEPAAESAAEDALVYTSRQLSLRAGAALARLQEPMPPLTRFKVESCPDQVLLADSPNLPERTLTLAVHDARYQAESLLPLAVTDPLQTRDDARLLGFYEPSQAELANPFERLLKSEADAKAAEQEVARLEQRQYKGVFHITLFKKPHLIRKKNKRRREWTRGVLRAWLAIYAIDTSKLLCQVEVISITDVGDAPITIRLRADTKQRLVRELTEELREKSQQALGSISKVLVLPEIVTAASAPQLTFAGLAQPPGMQ